MDPWQSWAVMIAGAGAAYWYYTTKYQSSAPVTGATRSRASTMTEASQPPAKGSKKRDEKAKRKPVEAIKQAVIGSDTPVTSTEEAKSERPAESGKKRKGGKKAVAPSAAPVAAVQNEKPEVEDDNKAWAQQMASMRKGANLEPPAKHDSRSRTVKASAAAQSPAFSSASSGKGAEADDDLTPALSPSLAAGDVSDMLEKTSSGPSVLRLTGTSDSKAARQTKQQKEFQTAESKKQRQNRKKVEERKLERETEEKDRQALLEKQRRTAREARGEPAKNGIPVSKAPAVNAWAADPANKTAGAPITIGASNDAPLLDTFDPDAESTSSSAGAANHSIAATSTVSNLESVVRNGEERAGGNTAEDVSGWNTVETKKQKKKVVGVDDAPSSTAPVEKPSVPLSAPRLVPAPAPTSKNGFASLTDSTSFDFGSHPDDSQWSA